MKFEEVLKSARTVTTTRGAEQELKRLRELYSMPTSFRKSQSQSYSKILTIFFGETQVLSGGFLWKNYLSQDLPVDVLLENPNFTKDKIEGVINYLGALLYRSPALSDKKRIGEVFLALGEAGELRLGQIGTDKLHTQLKRAKSYLTNGNMDLFRALMTVQGIEEAELLDLLETDAYDFSVTNEISRMLIHHPSATPRVWLALIEKAQSKGERVIDLWEISQIKEARTHPAIRYALGKCRDVRIQANLLIEADNETFVKKFPAIVQNAPPYAAELLLAREKIPPLPANLVASLLKSESRELRVAASRTLSNVNIQRSSPRR